MLLVERCFKSRMEESREGGLRRARCGAREAEVKDLVEEGIDGVLAEVQLM